MALIDAVIKWARKADTKKAKQWLGFARRYLVFSGWNDLAIEDWLDQGDGGFNNAALHTKYTVKQFYDEVHYCSDRMTLDRLFRCHVMFRNSKEEK